MWYALNLIKEGNPPDKEHEHILTTSAVIPYQSEKINSKKARLDIFFQKKV